MRSQELYERIRQGQVSDVSFDEFSALVEERGFHFDRFNEDYWVFEHPSLPGALGVKACDGKIQSFQALYLLRILERHELAAERRSSSTS